jgi:hypothetical protein
MGGLMRIPVRCVSAIVVVFAIVVLLPAIAYAAWSGKGWYQVDRVDMAMGGLVMPYFWSGPFQTEIACKGTLPKNDVMSKYSCEYRASNPGWRDFPKQK